MDRNEARVINNFPKAICKKDYFYRKTLYIVLQLVKIINLFRSIVKYLNSKLLTWEYMESYVCIVQQKLENVW